MMRKNALLLLYLGAFLALSEVAVELLLAYFLDPVPSVVVWAARAAQGVGIVTAALSFAYLRRSPPLAAKSGNEASDSLVSAHTVYRHYFGDLTRHLLLAGLMALVVGLYALVLYLHVLQHQPGGAYYALVLVAGVGLVLAAWWQPFHSMMREQQRLQKAEQQETA